MISDVMNKRIPIVALALSPVCDANGGVTVSWSSAAGLVYALQRAFRLTDSFQLCATNLPATPPRNSFRDLPPGGANPTVFYRVLVTP